MLYFTRNSNHLYIIFSQTADWTWEFFRTVCEYHSAKKAVPFIFWGSKLIFPDFSTANKCVTQSWNSCRTDATCPTTITTNERFCCCFIKTPILMPTFGKVSPISCLVASGASICKNASNCPTDILKYIWNRLHFSSSTRRWSFSSQCPKLSDCPVKTFFLN